MPRFMQGQIRAAGHVIGAVMCQACRYGDVVAAGRHGDTRNRRKSTQRAFRSWSLGAFPGPDQSDHLPLTFTTSSHAHLS